MRTIYWYLYFALSLIAKIPQYKKALKQKETMDERKYQDLINKIVGDWCMKLIKISGAKVNIKGQENIPDEAVLFVSNHQGNFDTAFLLGMIEKNKGFVAKTEMGKIPFVKDWMVELKCLLMNRKDMKQSAKTILSGIEILKSGYSMVVFPEGTRSRGEKIGEFKAGSFKLATKSKVKIVPVTINGSYKLMESNKNWIKPAKVDIIIHEPVETKGLTKEEETALCDKVRGIIEAGIS